jgi:FtsP/CotA-like multicopper oxidase with cupredoxin domain
MAMIFADYISGANLTQSSEGYEVITVKQNETYRFRVIGMGMDSMLTFSVENHTNLEIIEVDGILVDPVVTDYLQINSAQRYSVLIKMDQPTGNYWITTEMLPGPGPSNGKALLHYEGAPDPEELRKQVFEGESEELELDEWVLNDLHPTSNFNVKQPVIRQYCYFQQKMTFKNNFLI